MSLLKDVSFDGVSTFVTLLGKFCKERGVPKAEGEISMKFVKSTCLSRFLKSWMDNLVNAAVTVVQIAEGGG